MERTAFREALIKRLEDSGITAAQLARSTGVAKTQIDKLKQRKAVTTNYADAMAIAAYFGQTLEEFVGSKNGDLNEMRPILDLLAHLSPEEKQLVRDQLEGVVSRKRRPR